MEPKKNVGVVSSVDYFTTLTLSAKLADHPDPILKSILKENRETRRKMYQTILPLDVFLHHDKQSWEKMSNHFAAITGKDPVPYPFGFLLDGKEEKK